MISLIAQIKGKKFVAIKEDEILLQLATTSTQVDIRI